MVPESREKKQPRPHVHRHLTMKEMWIWIISVLLTSCRSMKAPEPEPEPERLAPDIDVLAYREFITEDSARHTCPRARETYLNSMLAMEEFDSMLSEFLSCTSEKYHDTIDTISINNGVLDVTYYNHDSSVHDKNCGSLEEFIRDRYWCPYELHAVEYSPADPSPGPAAGMHASYNMISRRFFDKNGFIRKQYIWEHVVESMERELREPLNAGEHCVRFFFDLCIPGPLHAETAWKVVESSSAEFVIVRKFEIKMIFSENVRFDDDGYIRIIVTCFYSKRRSSSRAFRELEASYDEEEKVLNRIRHVLLSDIR